MERPQDTADLLNQIQLEFLLLAQKFDPKRGVDFSGYIKLNLRHKIYYYITKIQKYQFNEQLARQYGDEPTNTDVVPYDRPDDNAAAEFTRVEALSSVPWEKLDESQAKMVEDILFKRHTLEQVAVDNHTSLRRVKEQFNSLCEYLIQTHIDTTRERANNESIKDEHNSRDTNGEGHS